jgi:hypothetical protein
MLDRFTEWHLRQLERVLPERRRTCTGIDMELRLKELSIIRFFLPAYLVGLLASLAVS